jgi:hypothetical protein
MYEISTDPEAIAQARTRAGLTLDPLEAALDDPHELTKPGCVRLVRLERARHIAALTARAATGAATDRLKAGIVLAFLDDPAGEQTFHALLTEAPTDTARCELLDGLAHGWTGVVSEVDLPPHVHRRRVAGAAPGITNPALAALLVGYLDDARRTLRASAVAACCALEPAGAMPRFLELMRTSSGNLRRRMATAHAFTPSRELVAWLEEAIAGAGNTEDRGELVEALATVAGGDGPLGEVARDWLHAQVAGAPLDNHTPSIMHALSRHPRAEHAAFYERVLAKSRDPSSRGDALAALVRTRSAAEAIELLQAKVDDRQLGHRAFELLSELDPENVVLFRAVLERARQAEPDERAWLLGRARAAGAPASAIEPLAAELGRYERCALRWQRTARDAVRQLISIGIVPPETSLDAIDDERRSLDTLYDALETIGVLLRFDTETGTVPPHGHLVRDFAWHARGRFQAAWISRSVGTYAAFEIGNQLFQVTLEDLGDYYDHRGVAEAVNAALAAGDVDERFHAVATGDQDAGYILAAPAAVRRACDELDLPW